MLSDIQVGNHFHWKDPATNRTGMAVVKAVRSSEEEHMGTEVSEYAALWIDVAGESGDLNGSSFTILLATDNRAYLDGHPIDVQPVR